MGRKIRSKSDLTQGRDPTLDLHSGHGVARGTGIAGPLLSSGRPVEYDPRERHYPSVTAKPQNE